MCISLVISIVYSQTLCHGFTNESNHLQAHEGLGSALMLVLHTGLMSYIYMSVKL